MFMETADQGYLKHFEQRIVTGEELKQKDADLNKAMERIVVLQEEEEDRNITIKKDQEILQPDQQSCGQPGDYHQRPASRD